MSQASTIYLDYAAATPVSETVLAAMQPYMGELFYNPSALYSAASQVAADLLSARQAVASCLGARPSEIIFTAGATESINLAIHGIMQHYPDGRVLTTTIEHDAVLEPAGQYTHDTVAVNAQGVVGVEAIVAAVQDTTVLVSVMYANNEIGTIQPIHKIGQALATVRKQRRQSGNMTPLYFHSDAAQAGNYLDLHVARLGVDLLSLNGGKVYGPKQTGILYIRGGLALAPLILGGGQEQGLRSGTENVAGAIGFATALVEAQQSKATEARRLQELQRQFMTKLKAVLPQVEINGSVTKRLPNNVHVTVPGSDNERLLIQLDEAGILAAAGSACSAAKGEPSHVLAAIGLSEAAARSSLRFSMGRGTTEADISRTVDVLVQLLA